MKIRILLLLENLIYNDKRALNQLSVYKEMNCVVTLIHRIEADKPTHEVYKDFDLYRIYNPSLHDIKNFKGRKEFVHSLINKFNFDVIHCHNQMLFYIGKEIKLQLPKTILIYESRELFHAWPLNFLGDGNLVDFIKTWIVRKYEIFREKKNSYLIDYLITVNDSLGANLETYFNLKNKAVIVRNMSLSGLKSNKNDYLKKKFELTEDDKILIFIGANVYPKTLNIEQVI